MATTSSAFDGIRVVDLSETLAGALASMHLADFGADVVRVEPGRVAERRLRAPYLLANRNKRIVEASRQGDEVAELVARADVVIVDDQPGVVAERGLDAATLRRRAPHLVHVWMPPHAEHGRPAGLPESELLLQAWTGMADQQPSGRGDDPAHPAMPLVQYEQAALAATAVAASLLERMRSGRGRALTVSGMHAAGLTNVAIMLDLPGVVRPYGGTKMGASGISPNFSAYRCRDGEWVFLGCLTPGFFFQALEVLDAMEVMVLPGVDGDFARLRTSQGAAREVLEAKFAERDSAEWLDILTRAGVPNAPIETRAQWAESPTVAAGRLLVELPAAGLGVVRLPDVGVELTATPGAVRWLPGPEAVAAADDVWRSVVVDTTEETDDTDDTDDTARPLPLEGLRVIDASSFIAGPLTSTILGDFGATVVKLEQPTGDEFRVAGASYSVINRSKFQVTADLKGPDGRALLRRLLADADVVLENMRPGVAERRGLDRASVAAVNQRAITCAIKAWGAGPLADTPGFDPLIQARSGLMRAQGRDDVPVLLGPAVHDIGVATLSAFGILAALVVRERDSIGQEVRASLSRTSLVFQAAEFTELRVPEAPGATLAPPSIPGRLHRCADGWVAVADSADGHDADDADTASRLGAMTVDDALAWLHARGAVAVPVLDRTEIFRAPDLEGNGFFGTVVDPDFGPIKAVCSFARWHGSPGADVLFTRSLGQDDEAVRRQGWQALEGATARAVEAR